MIDQHRVAFRDEANELLAELEESLLMLEQDPTDKELIGRVFRAMHTIKGSGAMFGFEALAAFTHDVETVFDLVRKGEIQVTRGLIALALRARDRIKTLLDLNDGETEPQAEESAAIVAGFRALVPPRAADAPANSPADFPAREKKATPEPPVIKSSAGDESIYWIRFRPPQNIFQRGADPLSPIDALRELGRVALVLNADDVPPLREIDPELCYVSWDVVLTTSRSLDEIKDAFIFLDEPGALRIEQVGGGAAGLADDKMIGEILLARGDVDTTALEMALRKQKRLGDYLLEAGVVAPSRVKAALVQQGVVREQRARHQAAESAASIRVPAERLDVLVNLVGELVTVQARFARTASQRREPDLVSLSEEVDRLTWALRDIAMNIRMLPIGTTFSKFKRLVHDLSLELGKEIELTTEGADTELDKTVIERLSDPLVHLIRNSIDHGIEMPDVRAAAGKPRTGTVRLSAEHSGANVFVRISDDGAGLDREAIAQKAIDRGLMAPGAELPDKELFGLIMLPGFSTAKTVSNVSGRGVGMDVVKQALDALGGSIEIESRPGAGTTLTIKLPLTLAIIDGLLVKVGADTFVLPLTTVQECMELTSQDVESACGRDIVVVRGHIVPYVRLHRLFGVEGERPKREHVVITEIEDRRVGFVVDRIVGQHQTVIKSLGRVYRGVPGVSGSTILGDGSVALILDLPKLYRRAEQVELAACA